MSPQPLFLLTHVIPRHPLSAIGYLRFAISHPLRRSKRRMRPTLWVNECRRLSILPHRRCLAPIQIGHGVAPGNSMNVDRAP